MDLLIDARGMVSRSVGAIKTTYAIMSDVAGLEALQSPNLKRSERKYANLISQ
jgi:hypothetical protein